MVSMPVIRRELCLLRFEMVNKWIDLENNKQEAILATTYHCCNIVISGDGQCYNASKFFHYLLPPARLSFFAPDIGMHHERKTRLPVTLAQSCIKVLNFIVSEFPKKPNINDHGLKADIFFKGGLILRNLLTANGDYFIPVLAKLKLFLPAFFVLYIASSACLIRWSIS